MEKRLADWQKIRRMCRSVLSLPAQNRLARSLRLDAVKTLVLFAVPTVDECNGGAMSIASLAATSRKLLPEATVLSVTLPGCPTAVRNDTFPNQESFLRFSLVCRLAKPEKLILHIPEIDADALYGMLSAEERAWMRTIPDVQINILNQNILYMRPREAWSDLFKLTENITQTTAHRRYTTQEVCSRYGIPTHLFSTRMDRSGWPRVPFAEKQSQIVFSPDQNEFVPRVRALVAEKLPDYTITVVEKMKFRDYLELVARSRFVLTFGEGLDGYFNQAPNLGTVGLAVYNDAFFPSPAWRGLANVYPSYPALLERLADDVRRWELDEAAYYRLQREHLALKAVVYPPNGYEDNLRRFYKGEYDFVP